MLPPDRQPWSPLPLPTAATVIATTGVRWWFTGGHALELHLGRSWRDHADLDIGVLRSDVPTLVAALPEWDVHLASAGRLLPVPDRPLRAARHENNLWIRRGPTAPWCLDIAVSEGDATAWSYRRRPSVRVPWAEAVLLAPDGMPYLAPELQLLHKSVEPRPKDDHDAAVVIPALGADRRARLASWLDSDHPWNAVGG